jgi:hypothetical protein
VLKKIAQNGKIKRKSEREKAKVSAQKVTKPFG